MNFWKKASKSDRLFLGGAIFCLAMSILLLTVRDQQLRAQAARDEQFLRFVDVAAEIYNEIQGKYVDEVKARDVLEGALAGMFSRLDEHSQYMDPAMLESLNKDTGGEFSGIGIHITLRQGLLTVIAPIPGSPSARLGIAPWDRIIEIDGETTEGMSLHDAVSKLTGPSGTQVTVKIFREGESEPLDFQITRATIKIDSVHYKMLEDNIGYLRIARFSENTTADMRRGLLDMKNQGMRGLILDLRFNSGGLLREAIEVSNLFVPKHELIVSTKGRLRSHSNEYRAKNDPLITDMPIFVLVNEGSASASEIVAGALQDHHLAVILGPAGKNTFGKGSVQTIEPLRNAMVDDEHGNPKDSAIRITTARYYTPSGRTIHQVGITPDVGIPLPKNHERDLIRHGLYGDTTIPLTKEEEEARRRIEEQRARAAEQSDEPTESTPVLQLPRPEAAPPTEQEGGTSEPFYARAQRPEFVENDTFRDVMLDEAIKQLKIFLILERREGQPAIAGGTQDAGLSMAK